MQDCDEQEVCALVSNVEGSSIKVGIVAPFSGLPALREYGGKIHAGTAAWINAYNAQGGHQGRSIELLVEDSNYDIVVTREAIRKLDIEDGIVALLNTNGTPQLTAALPYLKARRLPLLLPFAGAREWYDPPHWGVFGVQPPFNESGFLLGQWAALEGHRKAVIFYPDYPEISVEMAEFAQRGFQSCCLPGAQAIGVGVPLGSTDGDNMADAIAAHQPDAIVVLVNWPELLATLSSLKARGMELPLYSWAANVNSQIAQAGGAMVEGMKGHAAIATTPAAELPSAREYRERLAKDFPDQTPDFLSLTAYAHAQIFTAALDSIAGEVTRENIVGAFERLGTITTNILPPVRFASDRHLGATAIQPMQLRNGSWGATGRPVELPNLDQF
ncbi:ABC transporter substrate-binding protein [Altererythrobacter salegens]|uniref:ABC transporter substrate-binding protein n=1 Tax=Croceibacterium salegens TaxID=1737568 RepID=A0A6I4SXQ1_9SPHN|nr:ABC transporter substrate-binding protein [Croceibacterium salegens]MXO60633.1 ABC transporter substrate-binding protein [Croceibacterium salegens]